ncbi:pyocin knob domain-containing protein, partial [Avibacterium paragallinarum]
MANLTEQEKWEKGIYQIEENDPVHGGEDGITNKPIKQLANRTSWLKNQLETTKQQGRPKPLSATTTEAVESDGHTHSLPQGSTTQKGLIQLTDSINMASSVFGASALAVKTAFDKAESAYNLAESKQSPATTLAGYKIADFAQRALTASDNLNDITVKGIYNNSTYRNTPNNNYPEEVSGVLLVLSNAEQVYFASNGKMFKRLKSNNNWANGWVRLDNLTTPIGADQNLDEITTDGNYYIVGSSKATLAKNYPVERGDGALEVFGNGYFQRFTTFHSKQIFTRRKIGGNWTAWVQSMTELGGAFSGDVIINPANKLSARRIASTNNSNDALDIYSKNGLFIYNADNATDLLAGFRPNRIDLVRDVNLANKMLAFSLDISNGADFSNSPNIDGIWHDDTTNTFHFQSDSTYKTTGEMGKASLSAVNYVASGLVEIKNNNWGRLRATLTDGSYWQWEVDPNSATNPRFNFLYRTLDGTQRAASFPRLEKNEVVAYRSWVDEKIQSLITYQKIGNFQIRKYPDG